MQKNLLNLIKSQKLKKNLGVFIIIFGLVIFVYYLKSNPNALSPLKDVSFLAIPLLLFIYVFFMLTNFLITHVSIRYFVKDYSAKSSLLLTIYSAIVNFFGPLQSGPGFRAIYLKKQVGLSIKKYTMVAFLYYISFSIISLMMIAISISYFAIAIVILFGVVAFLFLKKKNTEGSIVKTFIIIFAITALQLTILGFIYSIELQSVGYSASINSILAYTGSSNLALFVAVTPGAIGIREWFIISTQNIHEIPTDIILSASLLDRAVYIIFLGILFIYSSVFHIRNKLIKQEDTVK